MDPILVLPVVLDPDKTVSFSNKDYTETCECP